MAVKTEREHGCSSLIHACLVCKCVYVYVCVMCGCNLQGLKNVARKTARVNPDLIDVDLVRGTILYFVWS